MGRTDAEILGISEDEEPARSYMLADLEVLSLKPGELRVWEERVPFKEGGLRTVLTRKFPIYAAGELLGLGVITSDITEYRQTENELSERDEDLRREHLRLSGIIEGTNVGQGRRLALGSGQGQGGLVDGGRQSAADDGGSPGHNRT